MNKKTIFLVAFFLFVVPVLALGADCKANPNVWNITILKGPLVTCTGDGSNTGGSSLPPCQSLCDLVCTSANVVYFGIGVVLWIIMPIMIAWSGLSLMMSRGSPEAASKARKMITGTVIGLAIVLCAYLIVLTFVNVLGITGVGGFNNSACQVQPVSQGQ